MNASEQRARHTAIDQAQACLSDLQLLLEELDRRTSLLAEVTKEVDERIVAMGARIKDAYDAQDARITELRTDTLWMANDLRRSVGQLHIRTWLLTTEPSFRQRLRWLCTGNPWPTPKPSA